ncbi:MAG TPA: winged helix-turn-helix domain-containing protein [Pyrinomonadaceae bacterium]|nr:winged helix-turn-helix domain-containing protein [Pyrinomonadaceae bacterium]
MSEQTKRVYEFGAFRLDVAEGILLHRSQRVTLTQKEFATLQFLVENPGRLVTKEELMTRLWPEVCVEPANLTQNIFVLRKALRQHEPVENFIETVAKRGYRFLSTVRGVKADNAAGSGAASESKVRTVDEGVRSLAVLPFANGTDDPNAEYLSEGLSESIINSLSHLRNVRVMARTSVFRFNSTEVNPLEVGRELGVSLVLTGRILQLANWLIVRVELADVRTGWQIWGDQYQRKLSDVLEMQEEIAGSISARLKERLTLEEKGRLSKRYTENAEAYQLYLKGRYHWGKFNLAGERKAVEYFLQAIEVDPTYALAYAGLADSYYRAGNVYAPTRDAMPKARAAALKALEIDDSLTEAHSAAGLIKLCYEWDWLGAEDHFRKAIEINSNYALAHQRLGLYFNLLGRFDEAKLELDTALTIDPLSVHSYWGFALYHFLVRDYERALFELQRALEMDGNYKPALYLQGRTCEELGDFEKAFAVYEKILNLEESSMFLAALGRAHARAGKKTVAQKVLKELEQQSGQRYVSAYSRATIHLALGDKKQTFSLLERAYEDRCEMMTWLKIDPSFDVIRKDPRFVSLLRRVGLHDEREALPAAS